MSIMNGLGVSSTFSEFKNDTLTAFIKKKAEVELGETTQTQRACLQILKNILKDEKDFRPCLEDDFLVPFLRVSKYDVSKATERIRNYYKQIKKYHEFFNIFHFATLSDAKHHHNLFAVPHRMKDGSAILVYKFGKLDFNLQSYEHAFLLELLVLGSALKNANNQICGVNIILDFEGFHVNTLMHHTPSRIRLRIETFQNTFPLRFKQIHIVNSSPIFSTPYNFARPLLSKKLVERVHIHPLNNWKELHSQIPAEVLPAAYGGKLLDSSLVDLLEPFDQIRGLLSGDFSTKGRREQARDVHSDVLLELVQNLTAR